MRPTLVRPPSRRLAVLRFAVLSLLLHVSAVLAFPSPAAGQALLRSELGRRLLLVEEAIEAHPDQEARRRASPHLQKAVRGFFALRFAEAGRSLDLARFAIEGRDDPAARWASSLSVQPERRLLDPVAKKLLLRITSFYPAGVDRPVGMDVAVRWRPGAGSAAATSTSTGTVTAAASAAASATASGDGAPLDGAQSATFPLEALPFEVAIPLGELPEGDHVLDVRFQTGDNRRIQTGDEGRAQTGEERRAALELDLLISLAANADRRIEAVASAIETLPASAGGTPAETVRGHVDLLRALRVEPSLEAQYPGARLLGEAEEAVRLLEAGEAFLGPSRPGEFWVRLRSPDRGATEEAPFPAAPASSPATSTGPVSSPGIAPASSPRLGLTVPARILVPRFPSGAKVPLAIALHGMGGSENLFFECHGAGKIRRLCEERGWLLVAPRSSLLGGFPVVEILGEVSRLYPVDPERVVLVGHSMGAQQVLTSASVDPQRFAAAAALGGGWQPRSETALLDLPLFIGVGSDDFARGGVERLHLRLQGAGAKRTTFRLYPDVEHLAIVQLALDDVFAFFDAAVAAVVEQRRNSAPARTPPGGADREGTGG